MPKAPDKPLQLSSPCLVVKSVSNTHSRRSWRGRDAHVEIDAAVLELDREGPGTALVGSRRLSVLEIDDPIVQWAGNLAAMHNPVAQRAAFVWTSIFQRK